MNKDASFYSANSRKVSASRKAAVGTVIRRGGQKAVPSSGLRWLPVAAALAITFMICLTINFRAYKELSREVDQNAALTGQIDAVTNDNLSLQEEIHYLRSDPQMIEREASKLGLLPRKDKVSVPDDK